MTFTVAHVNVAKAYRGGERQTELLIRQLAERGIAQRLVARRGAPLSSRLPEIALDIRQVPGGLSGVFAATAGADIVHVHEGRSVYAAYLRSLVSGTPYILTRRVDNPIGDHYFAHRAYRRAACVAAVSPQVADLVRTYDSRVDVCTVPDCSSGLASEAAATEAIRCALPGSFVVGHVGALDGQKGQEFIIEMARDFEHRYPQVCFVLVGGGRDEAMLKAAAKGLSNVVFTGFVDNVGDYLAAFDVFVLPSRREGLGSILLDAMDFGLPIVAARVGGVPAVVEDGKNGFLIDVGNARQLILSVERLLLSADMRKRFGQQGRELSARYSASVMADRYETIYRRLIGGAGYA